MWSNSTNHFVYLQHVLNFQMCTCTFEDMHISMQMWNLWLSSCCGPLKAKKGNQELIYSFISLRKTEYKLKNSCIAEEFTE